jgi:malate synthase
MSTATYDQAAAIFGKMMDKMSLTPEYPEFLTVPLCNAME